MNLEDHVGDIVRKAREMAGVPSEAGAKAAGLNLPDYETFEQSGTSKKQPDFAKVAALVGLNGSKLEKIAAGWLPSGKDLSRWRELRVITTGRGSFTVNCFLVWDEATREKNIYYLKINYFL